ncbi:acyltransferase family protein [Tunturiibacter lichenicola]|uniref:acyltransferase family protein n=1 Tax=Tunturiibacter lichenicola TaxID=2051959 RepID=UPI0021B3B551|nr:acyltransferase [Edaphobacter lichenicola]
MEVSNAEVRAPSNSSIGRVAELDSLRGVAAVAVVCHHCRNAFWTALPHWYFQPFFAGHEAVILFFVLSGYVLSLPMWANKIAAYPEYLARRVSRIYLPYLAAAVVAGIGCYFFVGSRLPLTPWFYETWQTPLSVWVVWQQLVMDPQPVLNTAFWSLRYEMEMSLIFPFLCLLMVRMGRHSGLFLVAATGISAYLLFRIGAGPTNLGQTIYYSTSFIAGAALSRERETLKRVIGDIRAHLLWLMLLLSIGAYCYGPFVSPVQRATDLLTMLGSCGVILLIQDPRLRVGLKSPVAEYLGRISYSSYLIHGTILFVGLNLLYGKVSMMLFAAIYGVTTLIAAHLFCIFIEEPSLRLGRRLAKRMQQRKTLQMPLTKKALRVE